MQRSIYLLCLTLLCGSLEVQAAWIKGKITDVQGEGLPFATLHILNTTLGTTSNEQGNFNYQIPAGSYTLVFQYIGYKAVYKEVTISENQTLTFDIQLQPEAFQLQEVAVNASDEDPAYAIIRNAMAKRKQYLEEVETYSCQTYLKGLNRMTKVPKKVLGNTVTIDTGVVYFSESVSSLSYQKPDQFKEVMTSSKVSGRSQTFSFNQASEMYFNPYENLVATKNFTERGLISPIAANAMSFYRYKYKGMIEENGLLINKIEVIPRSAENPTFYGHIYIIEDSWRIHSTDLYLGEGIVDFVDSVSIRQVFAPVKGADVWMPISQKFDFTFKVFGFEGLGYFVCIYSDYNLSPEFARRYFNNEVLAIQAEANKKDSVYWNTVRPVPLTLAEIKDYRVKDSLEVIKESKVYKDSVDRKRNRPSLTSVFMFGYTYRNSFRKYRLSFDPLANSVLYNTVEGWAVNLKTTFRKDLNNERTLFIEPALRYGFSSQIFYGKLGASYIYNPQKFSRIGVEGGHFVEQLNDNNPISPFANTLYTLLLRENFMKLYEKSYAKVDFRHELTNGLMLTTNVSFAQRNPLFNRTNLSDTYYVYGGTREFTPNAPDNLELPNTNFAAHQALQFELQLRIRFKQEYITYPEEKFILSSKFPTIYLNYSKGLPWLNSSVDFDLVTAVISDELPMGLAGTSSWAVGAGTFLNTNQMYFMDYYHFLGNQTLLQPQGLGRFFLLDYYTYSTNKAYLRAHWTHHFNGAILSFIPLIKKLKLQEVLSANYLYTEKRGHYAEFGVGLEHIFKFFRIDYVFSLTEQGNIAEGIRFGIGF